MKLPQLTLRDLFWLVLVCALAVGWWVERRRSAHFEFEYAAYKQMWRESLAIRENDKTLHEGLQQAVSRAGYGIRWSGTSESVELIPLGSP